MSSFLTAGEFLNSYQTSDCNQTFYYYLFGDPKNQFPEVILHPELEDGGYWVECPSQGETIEEALEMIKDAVRGHLEVLEEDEKLKAKMPKKARIA